MMMGLGSLGTGGSSSSSPPLSSYSSNLSALAPPFTVDRFSSNPLLLFSDSQPCAAAPFGHTWQYSNPSAPRPDMYPKYERDIDSTSITSVPLPDDYGFRYSVSQSNNCDPQTAPWSTVNPSANSSTGTFLCNDGKAESYYPPYVSSVVNDNPHLVALSELRYDMLPSSGLISANLPSQVDYTRSLSGLEHTPQRHGAWNGLLDAKCGRQAELDGSFSFDNTSAGDSRAYGNLLNQGYHNVKCGEFSDPIGRESSNGLLRMEHMDNMSVLAQNVDLSLPFDSSSLGSSCPLPASHLPGSYLHSSKNFINYQKSQNPCDKFISPFDSSVSGSISATKSSPALVIRPPPSGSALVPQKAASGKTVNAGNIAAVDPNEGLGNNILSKEKEPQLLLTSEVREGPLFTSQLEYQKEGNGPLFSLSSSVMEELSSKPQTGDGLNNMLEANSGLQVPNTNVSVGSSPSGDSFQAFKSSDNVPDCLDHHNFAVDSPCWKGAPASQFSPSDVADTESTHHFIKKIDKICQSDLQVDQSLSLPNGPIRCSPEKVGEDNTHECGRAGRDISLIPGNTSEANCVAGELRSVDAIKARFKSPIPANKPSKDYDLPKHSKNDSESKSSGIKQLGVEEGNITTLELNFPAAVMDPVLNTSDTAEGAIALCAAENVLCSPSSEKGAPNQAKSYGGESAPKMDDQAFVKVLQSVSELLLFSSLTESRALKDLDLEVLKHVRSNLDSFVSKKMARVTQTQEQMLQKQDNCYRLGGSPNPIMSTAAGQPQCGSEMGINSHSYLNYQNTREEKKNHNLTQEKAVKFRPVFPLMDDLDVFSDDNMAQAIRKVLEENFHCGEEMESQALLFKNLWLEAEAKLCSITCRVRFDRMKNEMQKFKSNQRKAASENTSSTYDVNISDAPLPKIENDSMQKTTISSLPYLSSTSNANDVEASVMNRFHILKCRDDSKCTNLVGEELDIIDSVSSGEMVFLKDQAKDGRLYAAVEPHSCKKYDVNRDRVGLHIGSSGKEPVKDGLSSTSNANDVVASIMTRFHNLKCHDDSKNTNLVRQQVGMADAGYGGLDLAVELHSHQTGNGKQGHVGLHEGGSGYSGIMPSPKDQCEYGGLDLAVEPHSHQTGNGKQGHVVLHEGGSGYESVRDFLVSVQNDPVTQPSTWNAQRSQYSLGYNDNCSSDWEHVLKDDVPWS